MFFPHFSLSYLDRCVKTALPGAHNDEWQPLIIYRGSLQQNEFEMPVNRAPGRQYNKGNKKRGKDDEGRFLSFSKFNRCSNKFSPCTGEEDGESDQESEIAE